MLIIRLLDVRINLFFVFFFFNDTATTEIYTLSYTTLFRSRPRLSRGRGGGHPGGLGAGQSAGPRRVRRLPHRSEEHTSELQSQSNLVCRLLLEKKKKINNKRKTEQIQ